MANSIPPEEWKPVKFDFEYVNNLRIEVSNHGRVRTFSEKSPDGFIINGSMINGYRIVRFKFFKARDAQHTKRFEYLREQIAKLDAKFRKELRELKALPKGDANIENMRTQVQGTKQLLESLKAGYRKEHRTEELSRTINKGLLIHRLVAENFLEKPTPEHSLVGHKDFDKMNNIVTNLAWMTPDENIDHQQKSPAVIQDKIKRVGLRRNRKNYKLSESSVMLIKKRILEGVRLSKLAKQFKVTETQLMRIKRGENWADVQPAS